MPAAARLGDPIGHSKALTGFVAGAVTGLVFATGVAIAATMVAGAVAAEVVTAGLATPLVAGVAATVGEIVVSGAVGSYLSSKTENIGENIGSKMQASTGLVVEGSSNVFINGKPAAFVTKKVVCSKIGHPSGDMVAEGASTVFINGQPAGRVGDQVVCGGKIMAGSSNVIIGSPTKRVLSVNPEVPHWVRTAAFVASFLPGVARGAYRLAGAAIKAVAEKGLVGAAKAGGKAVARAMERRAIGAKGQNFYKTKYLKEHHAAEIADTKANFKTHGVSYEEAKKYLNTEEGRKYIDKMQKADPNASLESITDRAVGNIQSGSTLPKSEEASSPLYKIVPPEEGVTAYSPYFMKKEELEAAQKSGKNLGDYFGLPVKSERGTYDVYEVTPRSSATVWSSKIAPASDLGGIVIREGGGEQTLILNRGEWNEPVKIGQVKN
ncbi:PAAR domain-containing protein [Swingsia samuiensis]|uniref:Double-stranded DNA deaminase toxin A prePAAR motif domain-containing protein n=1 Tax=Swingsia samuiensis TaxID=1293412 RepID=A0A4Y6UHZ5_9PROT|nr:PAAR domain-containing protein [Swingsia samuiensis]QDH17193.1 hypothetical protein E3D00_06165 [Swingsia samuiensis]